MCAFIKINQIVLLGSVHLTMCEFYFNEKRWGGGKAFMESGKVDNRRMKDLPDKKNSP